MSGEHTPTTPIDNEEDGPTAHISPSFDYHEERRLHLKDEIWLSHHLPRLPPSAISDAESSLASSSEPPKAIPERRKSVHIPGGGDVPDPRAAAFPRGSSIPKADGEWLSRTPETERRYQHISAAQAFPGSSIVSPSGPEYGDLDPAASLIHRQELDSQERLDLEEEARERELSSAEAALVGLNLGTQPFGAGSRGQPVNMPPEAEPGVGSELEALYASFARCLELRDKYMDLSCQRLGDNPRDHDGTFKGFSPKSAADINGLKADVDPEACEQHEEEVASFPPWKIYPPPPPPHWHWKPAEDGVKPESSNTTGLGGSGSSSGGRDSQAFKFEECEIPGKDPRTFEINDEGVYEVWVEEPVAAQGAAAQEVNGGEKAEADKGKQKFARIPRLKEYYQDLEFLLGVCSDGPAKSFAFRRLKYLASKWSLYCLLNEYQELADMKAVPHRDFYNVRKVDTHIHHSASMNQKHLLRFIKSKLKKAPDEIVIHRDGKDLTLKEVFESLNLTAYDLSIDTLDMHAHQEFHRFDRFNDRYNPTGSSRLREIFLKTDNLLKGKYLAELTQELIADLEQSKYQNSEWRLSIYGRNVNEWDKLAKWVINHNLLSHNVRWLIQIPRLYEVYKGAKQVDTFADIVKNVFQPLFEVTQDPSSHPELHVFLQRVVGFDSVDDESKPERRNYRKFPTAPQWNTRESPPYSYWIYYMYANMASLNKWRQARGFNTFVLRPHCGEAGDPDHLSSAFLTSHSIAHGILLRKVPALQYLFYLKQIGLAMSPLSNNALFLTYERNPFKDFFRTGLNVSLSTDDPLQFHFTASHLLEEYSCAAQIYKLTPADMCELARNSVLQSGWEMQTKKHWIGHKWYLPGAAGNDIHKTNVPTIRLAYRHATLLEELTLINHGRHSPSATPTHLKPSAGNAPPDRTLADSRPGITSRPSDVGAAAMAVTKAVQPSGGVPHLVGAASVLDERARKKSQTGLRAQAEKSAEIKN